MGIFERLLGNIKEEFWQVASIGRGGTGFFGQFSKPYAFRWNKEYESWEYQE